MDRDVKEAPAGGEGQLPAGPAPVVPHLLFLKLMVGGLSVAMALGLGVIVTIMWLRLNTAPLPELPPEITLPQGASPAAVTFGRDRLIVLTTGGAVLVYDRDGTLLQDIALDQP